jgi:branched-chain amino acid transport system ATP-binding protein
VAALGSKTDNKEIEMIMSELRLDKYKDVKVMNVSFGVQKLVELAMALLLKPKLLILDEPAAGLPREDRKNLMRILKEIGEKITLLIIEHDMEFVFELAQRIMVMNRGKIIADGKPDDIINNSIVREIYLGES